jgi:hypothetical protein
MIPCLLVAVALAQDAGLPERQATFLKGLQEGKTADAYAELLRGSLVLANKAEVDNLVAQTEKGVSLYGGVTAHDNLGLTKQTKLVAYGTAVVGCTKAPLFFYFVWYRPREDAAWRIQNVWFDDQARSFFEPRK